MKCKSCRQQRQQQQQDQTTPHKIENKSQVHEFGSAAKQTASQHKIFKLNVCHKDNHNNNNNNCVSQNYVMYGMHAD